MRDDRGTGKTTRLFEQAVDLIADGQEVYVTGAHTRWLLDLKRRFHGLVGVHVLTVPEIRNGALRGRRGVLLIDDWWDLSDEDFRLLYWEERRLRPSTAVAN